MVIMKVRPARELDTKAINECMSHMGLTTLCSLDPTVCDIDERLIATGSLDAADIAVARSDWAQMKQRRRVQVKADMEKTDTKRRAKCNKSRSMVNVEEEIENRHVATSWPVGSLWCSP